MNIERELKALMVSRGLTLAVAESCTGGLVGHRVTSVPGSSAFFRGGVLAYANDVKARLLGVRAATLTRTGAVSEPVARQMAEGVRRLVRTDLGVGITGIAGPDGGTARKPVGLVYIGLAFPGGSRVRRFVFQGSRRRIKCLSSEAALTILRDFLKKR